ncbi:hypothetical protein JCM10908_000030 [Rhodotorula pacifica]|uniref:zinc finger MYND domain-containing protein n=1 Tax=Rhodotorula pacifica TaxID=1495444 RepID=UPI0031806CE0
MSTTGPTATGACLVCGTASTLRCSACASKGNIDLFFCSTEHQKLIWPYHRLVCGERSHPFRLPPFSKEEADVTYTRATELPESAKNAELHIQLQKLVLARGKYSHEELKPRIYSLIGVEIPMIDHRCKPADLRGAALGVYGVRMLGTMWTSPGPPKSPGLAILEAFGGFYHTLLAERDVADDSLWYSEFCHRVVVQLALMFIVTSTQERGGSLDDQILKAREDNLIAMRRFSETATDPNLAVLAAASVRSADQSLDMLRKLYGTRTMSCLA